MSVRKPLDLAKQAQVSPSGALVAIAQNRILENLGFAGQVWKLFLYREINGVQDIDAHLLPYLPGILKNSDIGLHGKGQTRINALEELSEAFPV